MPHLIPSYALLLLQIFAHTYAGPLIGRPLPEPVRAAPKPGPTTKPAPTTQIITTTFSGSTYTLTYVPSTVTAPDVITESSVTATVNVGAIVGALAGGAAVAAAAYFAPKYLPELSGEEEDDEDWKCEKKTVAACTQDCTADWFISSCQVQTTSSCAAKACSTVTGCFVLPTISTVSHDIPSALIATVTSDPNDRPTTLPNWSIDPSVLQAYLGQAYQRLGIGDTNTPASDTQAQCETDPSKGALEQSSVKQYIKEFCKSNNGGTASPNKGLLMTYTQLENRMQAVLQVTYSGDRGQGAVYTVQENTCNSAFSEITKCEPDNNGQLTSGGNFTQDTGVFCLEPYTYPGVLTCAPKDAKYGLQQAEAMANVQDFCKQFDGKNITDSQGQTSPYFQTTGGLLNTVAVNWAPASVGCGKGEAYDYGYTINEAACYRFLGQVINGCNTNSLTFKAGGTVTDQCATYSVVPTTREALICTSDSRYTDADRAGTNLFDADAAYTAIDQFCAKDLLADPTATTTGFSQDGTWPKGIAKGNGTEGIGIAVTFPGGCTAPDTPKNQAFNTGDPDCHRILRDTIINQCDMNPGEKKRGGSVISSGLNGCVQWQLLSTGG